MNAEPKSLAFSWSDSSDATYYRLLIDDSGLGNFSQWGDDFVGGTLAYRLPVSVHSFDWANTQFMLQACNTTGCTASNVISAESVMVGAIGYFKSSNSDGGQQVTNGIGDYFGFSVAIASDGRTFAAAAIYEDSAAALINGNGDDNSVRDSGAVYLFVEGGNGWEQQAFIKAPNTGAFDQFGHSLALSADGNTLAVGALYEASAATGIGGDGSDNTAGASGAVYIYVRSGDVWSLQAYIKASNTDAGDEFGMAIDLSDDGNTLIVGAPEEASAAVGVSGDQSDNSATAAGAVYVFNRTGSSWTQSAYVKASNTDAGDRFGSAVTLSGDGLSFAVSASGEDSNATGINGDQTDNSLSGISGAVYVFHFDSTWQQQAYIKPSTIDSGDVFGSSIALSADGNILVAGAKGEDSIETGINPANEADNSATSSGAVFVFSRSGASWVQQAYIKASNTKQSNLFGDRVDVSADGRSLLVGANKETSRSVGINGDESQPPGVDVGAAYLFYRDGNSEAWSQTTYIKPSNSNLTTSNFGRTINFGRSVAISGDATAIVVGGTEDASDARGIGGDQENENANHSGAVYLF